MRAEFARGLMEKDELFYELAEIEMLCKVIISDLLKGLARQPGLCKQNTAWHCLPYAATGKSCMSSSQHIITSGMAAPNLQAEELPFDWISFQ